MTAATVPEGRWWLDPGLAKLAFGSQFARPGEGLAPSDTHLAFLPPDALALDLSDPAQAELGDYRLQELVGQGGMGVVYRAWQKSLEREVAVKLLSAGPWASEEFIDSFRREARHAASLQHPNIVAVYEMGEQDGLIFYAMHLVRGTSLAEVLRQRGTLPAREATLLLRTIAEAVDYAHRMGVLHLDLKPGNVLVDERGVAMVTDFGLARRLGQAPSVENEQVSGTPSYMAPEQAQVRSQGLSVATDIWGMGAILYELLTGVPPFTGRDPREILQNVLNGTVRRLSRHARIPDDLEAICLRCLRKEPSGRYASARELADDLGRFLEHRSVQARPLNVLQRIGRWAQREPKLAVASAMTATALVTGLVATTHQWSRAEFNAGIASQRLWEGRREAALQMEADGRGWQAAERLLDNISEQLASGRSPERDRLRLGMLLGQGATLVDSSLVADATPLAVAVSEDGRRIALALGDRSVRWYDAATLVEQGRIDLGEYASSGGELRAISRLRFAGPDQLLATQEWYRNLPSPTDGDTWLLDLRERRRIEAPASFPDFSDAAFSADARTALLRDQTGAVEAWQVSPWQKLSGRRPAPGSGEVVPWRIAPDGRYALALSQGQRRLHLYALPALAPLHELQIPQSARISAWSFSPGGEQLALGDDEGRLYLLDLPDGGLRALPSARGRAVTWLEFSDDGGWLVAGAEDGRAHAFDAASGNPLVSGSMDHDFPIRRVGIDRSQRLMVVSGDGPRALWRLPAADGPGALPPIRIGLPPAPHAEAGDFALDWSRDGLLASAGHEGTLRLWRLPAAPLLPATLARQPAERPGFAAGRVVDVAWNQVRVLDARGRATRWLELAQPPGFAELADDGRLLLTSVGPSLLRHDADTLVPRGAAIALPDSPQRLLVSPDGQRVVLSFAARDADGFAERLQAWDLASGRALPGTVQLRGPLLKLGYAGEHRLLAVGPADAATTVLDMDTLQPIDHWPHDPFEPVVAADAVRGGDTLWLLTRADDLRLGRDSLLRWRPGEPDVQLRLDLAIRPFAVGALAHGGAFVAGELAHAVVDADGKTRRIPRGIDPTDTSLGALAVREDGQVLAVSGRHGVQVFDATGEALGLPLRLGAPPTDGIFDLAFGAGARRLYARTVHGAARWPVGTPEHSDAELAARLAWLDTDREAANALMVPPTRQRARWRADDPGAWPSPGRRPVPALAGYGRDDASPIPARAAGTPATALDLTSVYAVGPDAVRNSASAIKPFLRPWPAGWQRIGGVDFDIRGMADVLPQGLGRCLPVPGGRVTSVHALMVPTLRSPEHEPRLLAELRLHYGDGGSASVPLRATRELHGYGEQDQDVPQAFTVRAPRAAMGFRTVTAAAPRLDNPEPDRPVRCLDLHSTREPHLLLALSVTPGPQPVADPVIAGR